MESTLRAEQDAEIDASPDVIDEEHLSGLRYYQRDAVTAAASAFKDNQTGLIVSATGTGKTVMMGAIAKWRLQDGRVLVIANRSELVFQLAKRIEDWCGTEVDIEKAALKARHSLISSPRVVVASVQTMASDKRLSKFDPYAYSVLMVDEAHHSLARTFKKIIQHFRVNPNCIILGVTATPDRGDKRSLGEIYSNLIFEYNLKRAIADGFLVPIRIAVIRLESAKLDDVDTSCGDFDAGQLECVMAAPEAVQKVATHIVNTYRGRKTLMFAAGCRHAQQLADVINAMRPGVAQTVFGTDSEEARKEIFGKFHSGVCPILVQVDVAGEGYDHDGIEIIAMVRPTKSRSRYAQCVGRGTRPLAGTVESITGREECKDRRDAILRSPKPHLEIYDYSGVSTKHDLVCAVDLMYEESTAQESPEYRAAVRKAMEDEESHTIEEIKEKASEYVRQQNAEKWKAEIHRELKVEIEYIDDPFCALGVKRPNSQFPGAPAWADKPITDSQKWMLKAKGVPDHQINGLNRWLANKLIMRITERAQKRLCTFRQARLLAKNGIDPRTLSVEDASRIIDQIAIQKGWRK